MIYTKKANFPYPVLMNFTDDYKHAKFELDVVLHENTRAYLLDISWNMQSAFIKKQLRNGNASLVLIIKSKDNQFHVLDPSENQKLVIPKNRLCLNARTVMQLMVQSKRTICFQENEDLDDFYSALKNEISVNAGMVLGFSNTVIFDGTQHKPFELFERKVDATISSDIEIRLGEETILIVYKNEALQFLDLQNSRELNYPYLYLGLQKALLSFLIHVNPESPEEGVCIDEMEPPEHALDGKLYQLMQAKNITELHLNNIDEIIYQMSDKLMLRYADAIRGLQNAN